MLVRTIQVRSLDYFVDTPAANSIGSLRGSRIHCCLQCCRCLNCQLHHRAIREDCACSLFTFLMVFRSSYNQKERYGTVWKQERVRESWDWFPFLAYHVKGKREAIVPASQLIGPQRDANHEIKIIFVRMSCVGHVISKVLVRPFVIHSFVVNTAVNVKALNALNGKKCVLRCPVLQFADRNFSWDMTVFIQKSIHRAT